MRIIDFHAHVFPDSLAERAMPALQAEGNITARLDGKVSSLLRSMDKAGIEKSVVCSIATKPEQYGAILKWSKEIASDRIMPLPSVHPDDPHGAEHVRIIHEEGFKGIKLHPYYQEFTVDDERMIPLYGKMQECGLFVVMHTGFDLAYRRVRRGDPVKTHRVLVTFPQLKFITTHLGAWDDWDQVEKHLLGKSVYMEISFSIECMTHERARRLLLAHPQDYLLFGTDSPWTDQKETLDRLLSLDLGAERQRHILYENADRLLASC